MNRREFSRNIASSLTRGSWSNDFLLNSLLQRLPRTLHKFAPDIACEIFRRIPSQYAPSVNSVANILPGIHSFEKVFRYCQKHDIWPSPDLKPPVMSPISALSHLEVPQLATTEHLASWLMLSTDRLEYLADRYCRFEEHGEMAINHYHYILKKKKSSGVRVIEAPKLHLKSLQRQILQGIVDKLPNHKNAYGFIKGRNCLQAAQKHAGEDVVIGFDLKDFFPSIRSGRVFGLFRSLGYPHTVARYLTALCTTATPPRILERLNFEGRLVYRNPHLPQGSPTSPALANCVLFGLDRRLSALANSLDANYTRYADDLSFSGDHKITGSLLRAVPRIIKDEGFSNNQAKTRVMPRASRQMVTGIVVNEHLNIDRKTFDQLKAVIHACGKPDDTRLLNPVFRAALEGKINWAETVNPMRGQKLRNLLEQALSEISFDMS